MKTSVLILLLALGAPLKQFAQTAVNRTIPVKAGQSIEMHFDYPELIRVTTWDGDAISITGQVEINGGENDDAFVLTHTAEGNALKIHSEIRDLKNLPQRITVRRDGQTIMFRNKEELRKYQAENGTMFNSISMGPQIDVTLEIKVPKGFHTTVESVYGIVEVKNFSGPLSVEATYGAVDAALEERSVGELSAETNYGQIYSNLDAVFGGDKVEERNFYTHVTAKPGQGPRYSFESKYGNVYLRKANIR